MGPSGGSETRPRTDSPPTLCNMMDQRWYVEKEMSNIESASGSGLAHSAPLFDIEFPEGTNSGQSGP